jgi:hypothetical protein
LFIATADTNEAVYVVGPGAADNWMATSNAPLNSLRAAFSRFDLEPGDRIWVDTGAYIESQAIAIGLKNSGTTGNPVRVVGNWQRPYHGSVLARAARTVGSTVFQISNAQGVHFENLMISNAVAGMYAANSGLISLERVRVAHCFTNAIIDVNARMDFSRSIVDQALLIGVVARGGSVVKAFNCLFQDNGTAHLDMRGGNVEVKNSILTATGSRRSSITGVPGARWPRTTTTSGSRRAPTWRAVRGATRTAT